MRDDSSIRRDRWWVSAALVGVVAVAAATVWWTVRDRPQFDQELWCDRAVAMVQANEDFQRAGLLGGFEEFLPGLEASFYEREAAVLELVQPEELDGLIPYGGDASKYVPVWDFVASECGYRFDVNNGRLPEEG